MAIALEARSSGRRSVRSHPRARRLGCVQLHRRHEAAEDDYSRLGFGECRRPVCWTRRQNQAPGRDGLWRRSRRPGRRARCFFSRGDGLRDLPGADGQDVCSRLLRGPRHGRQRHRPLRELSGHRRHGVRRSCALPSGARYEIDWRWSPGRKQCDAAGGRSCRATDHARWAIRRRMFHRHVPGQPGRYGFNAADGEWSGCRSGGSQRYINRWRR